MSIWRPEIPKKPPEIEDMEGPFWDPQNQLWLYYDPIEGRYYDRATDTYGGPAERTTKPEEKK